MKTMIAFIYCKQIILEAAVRLVMCVTKSLSGDVQFTDDRLSEVVIRSLRSSARAHLYAHAPTEFGSVYLFACVAVCVIL